jgi:hypothetical protein
MGLDEIPISPLSKLALEKYQDEDALRKKKTREVCVCGHSLNFHTVVEGAGVTTCNPAKMLCKCSEVRAVVKADNLRLFMYVTSGVGAEHALGKGLVKSVAKGAGFQWINAGGELTAEPCCDICRGVTAEPLPVAVDVVTGRPTTGTSSVNKIVCLSCYMTWISE